MFTEACLMHLILQDQQFNSDQSQNKNQKQDISIQNYLIYYQSSLITRSLNQIQSLQLIEDKEAPFNILNEIFVVYGGFDYLENELKTVIHTLNICYDKYYLQSFQFYIPAYLNFFKNFMEFWQKSKKDLIQKLQIEDQFDDQSENLDQDQNQSEEQIMYNQQLKVSNYIRQIIMRIQPLILNQNKVISVQSVQIFQLSAPLLFKQRMQVEQHDQNFSTNDANNVIIPDALGAITVEMLNIFKYVLKNMKEDNSRYVGTGYHIILTLKDILKLKHDYTFFYPQTFQKDLLQIFGEFLANFEKYLENSLKIRSAKQIVEFLSIYKEKYQSQNFNFDENIEEIFSRMTKIILKNQEVVAKNENVTTIYQNDLQQILNVLIKLL